MPWLKGGREPLDMLMGSVLRQDGPRSWSELPVSEAQEQRDQGADGETEGPGPGRDRGTGSMGQKGLRMEPLGVRQEATGLGAGVSVGAALTWRPDQM